MSRLNEIAERDGWRCWLCDQPVDPTMSSNDSRAASVDSRLTKAKSKGIAPGSADRLAHLGCNTKKGAIEAVVPWPDDLFVVDPAPIIAVVDRLQRKGGREIMARCPTGDDAQRAANWLSDRMARLAPDLPTEVAVEMGGGQYLLVLTTPRR